MLELYYATPSNTIVHRIILLITILYISDFIINYYLPLASFNLLISKMSKTSLVGMYYNFVGTSQLCGSKTSIIIAFYTVIFVSTYYIYIYICV